VEPIESAIAPPGPRPAVPGQPPSAAAAAPFRNDPLDVAALPQLDTQPFTSLERRYLVMRLMIGAAIGLVVLGAAIAFGVLAPEELPNWARLVAIGLGLCALATPFIFEPIAFAHRGWLLREHDISVRSGIVSRRVTTAPFARVQHASVHQSALERVMGLSSMKVFTAGNQFADLTIEGLTSDEAHRLKELVVSRTRFATDV